MVKNKVPNKLGVHRVLDQTIKLPQAADQLDNSTDIYDNEILIDVEALQIDSASFHQLCASGKTFDNLKKQISDIVSKRGKMQNPVTGSGGMLLGKVIQIGKEFPDKNLKVNDKIATLISLTSTPLKIEKIADIEFDKERVLVKAKAILFASSIYAVMPKDIDESVALSAFDICGAPALVAKNVQKGQRVLVIGLGKAGKSCLAALELEYGKEVSLFGVDPFSGSVEFCESHFLGNYSVQDATNPLEILDWSLRQTQNELFDFVINTTNVSDTEMSTILSTKDEGSCLFFGMATNFQKAALGAEAVAKDIRMLIGSGYTKGHAEYMMNLLRKHEGLQKVFF